MTVDGRTRKRVQSFQLSGDGSEIIHDREVNLRRNEGVEKEKASTSKVHEVAESVLSHIEMREAQ